MKHKLLALLLASSLPMLMAHGDEGGCSGGEEEEEAIGPSTNSACAEGTTLTYETFGRTFMESYCTRCHSSTLSGPDRKGAPVFHDFDTVAGVRAVAEHIDQVAASGPGASNTLMPPGGPMPSLEERQQLAIWLACGSP